MEKDLYTENVVTPAVGMEIIVDSVGFKDLPTPVRATITAYNVNTISAVTADGIEFDKLYSKNYTFVPVVGMPVSYSGFTDVYPGTIVEVNKKGNRMKVRPDGYIAIGGTWPAVEYAYYPNPDAYLLEFRLNKHNRWKLTGGGYSAGIGGRRYYCDPHF